jgi:hypothetical protein
MRSGSQPLRSSIVVSAVCLTALWTPTHVSAQTNIRERLAAAVETVEGACAADISGFCGKVTRGEGRLLSCMQAYDDQLSKRCQLALYRASRNLEGALNRVERVADACWTDIEAHCGEASRIGQCVVEKRASLSQTCQSVVADLRKAAQGLAALRGLPVFSSDGADVGQVVDVVKTPDGTIQSIRIEIGRSLGIAPKVVTVNADTFEQLADRVRLQLGREDVQRLPETTKR